MFSDLTGPGDLDNGGQTKLNWVSAADCDTGRPTDQYLGQCNHTRITFDEDAAPQQLFFSRFLPGGNSLNLLYYPGNGYVEDILVHSKKKQGMPFATAAANRVDSVTKRNTWRGWILVAPNSEKIEETMSLREFNEYRVKNMITHKGYEITPDNHPLACGLGDLVHEAKGCYIGQEILARMRSRGRQGKELVRLQNPVENATTEGKTHSLAIVRANIS